METIDLSNVDTSETTDMSRMFPYCRSLNTIITPINVTVDADLSTAYTDDSGNTYSFLTKNLNESIILTRAAQSEWLKDYEYVVSGDKIILTQYTDYDQNVTIPGTAEVNGTEYSTIEISSTINWGGEYVDQLWLSDGVVFPDDSTGLFSSGQALRIIDLSNIDTSNVTNMSDMFAQCYELESLDVSGFDTSNVTDMSGMFSECNKLETLDLSNWDMSSVNSADHMFGTGNNLVTINAPAGLTAQIDLPAIYTGSDGIIYKTLPMNKDQSITLTWTSEAGDPAYEEFSITEQPADVCAAAGSTVAFTVVVKGNDPSYQWQWSTNGTTWKNCTSGGYNEDTFSFLMKDTLSGRQYRCKVTCGGETLISDAATITLFIPLEIISQPSDVEAAAGETVTFTVGVQGKDPAYQWQYSTNGTTWKNCTSGGYNADTFSFLMKATLSGRQYRCKVTCGEETLISDAATITLFIPLEIISQPSDAEAAVGENVVFSVEAQSNVQGEEPAYQWQYSTNGTTWKNCTSGTCNTDTFSFTMKATVSGRQYRCKVTCGGETLISDAATITLFIPLEIISQPSDVEAAVGENVVLSVEAQSNVQGEEPAYQWQWSSNGTTWKNCTSGTYNTDTFSFVMKATLSGCQYRCKVTCGGETLISEAGTITLRENAVMH